jgi:hypothetical protein
MNLVESRSVKRLATIVVAAVGVVLASGTALGQANCTSNPVSTFNTANGVWTLSPGINQYQTQVSGALSGGLNTFPAKRGVIPVQFSLSEGIAPVTFQSIGSDGYFGYPALTKTGTTPIFSNDCSYLSFAPSSSLLFSQLKSLSAGYFFTTGDCHGGSLRWSISTSAGTVFVYYGLPPEVGNGGTGGCTGSQSQSGTNLIGNSTIQYDTSQITDGSYFDNYAHTLQLVGSQTVTGLTLVLESGWQQAADGTGDQALGPDSSGNYLSANVATASTSDTFTPPNQVAIGPTCALPQAQVQVTKISGANQGIVDNVLSVSAADTTGYFRVVDCHYMYNMDVSNFEAGTYSVGPLIGGALAGTPIQFTLK